jgi:pimeloyl-ACP methyl ester carboxylesterase
LRYSVGRLVAAGLGLMAPQAAAAEILREDFKVQGTDGVELAVREVRDTAVDDEGPLILIHGARVSGIPSFDLDVAGGSLAAELARAGHRVFVMDARGYGGSDRPGQDGPREGEPLGRSADIVEDIHTVVSAVEARTADDDISLLGWATGGHWAGMYASAHPGRIDKLVVYNSLYGAHRGHKTLGPGSDNADPDDPEKFNVAEFGRYRLNTGDSLLSSWDKSIPDGDKSVWRDPAVAEAYVAAALASDPTSADRQPPSFRAPSGAMADSFEIASGKKLWDARAVEAQVLIIRSGNDFWSRPEDVTLLKQDLVNADEVRAVTFDNATHYAHLDRGPYGRDVFLREVISFLGDRDMTD